ncbi:MAG: hypothetical protein IT327_25965 [Anaerolineae bacterium]|nr:hypothetical protein [Anaerolineae bacterium]
MTSLSLQSWLVQNERRMHLKCPEGLTVSQDEYLQTLRETAKELQLPLAFETVNANWEDANLRQTRIKAKLNDTKERYGILTGLDYIGRVAFVEQKTYLDPLEIPKLEDPNYQSAIIVGGLGIVLGGILMAVGDMATCLGALLFLGGIVGAARLARNAKSEPAKKLEEAVNKWVKDVTDLARRAEVSNELNNTAQALDEAVKLAVDRLFIKRGAEMEADQRNRKTAAEIQNELNMRKEEFK